MPGRLRSSDACSDSPRLRNPSTCRQPRACGPDCNTSVEPTNILPYQNRIKTSSEAATLVISRAKSRFPKLLKSLNRPRNKWNLRSLAICLRSKSSEVSSGTIHINYLAHPSHDIASLLRNGAWPHRRNLPCFEYANTERARGELQTGSQSNSPPGMFREKNVNKIGASANDGERKPPPRVRVSY